MRFTLLALILCFAFNSASAQAKIDISSNNYDKDFVIIGYYFGDRQLVLDTVMRNDQDQFVYENEENLSAGMYLLLLSPNNRYIQFLVNENEQSFSINIDTTELGNLKIAGSADNQLFLDYVSFLNEKGSANQKISEEIKAREQKSEDIADLQAERKKLDTEVKAYQKQLIADHPTTTTAKLVSSTLEIVVPDFEGNSEEIQNQQYYYYRSHYFDHIDLSNPVYLRTPFLNQKIDSYLNKLTPQAPDSLIRAIDYLLGEMEPAKESFQFYLSHFLNTYASSKVVGHDGIYVHLVDNYYAKGKADWVDDESLTKIVAEANKIRPTLLGKIAQDITVFRKDKTPISMSDIKSKYLILYFWAPDCGHCKKATPHVVEFYKKYKDSIDVEVLAVCTKVRDKEKTCWDAVEEKGMDLWINASDINHTSRFKMKFNVEQTPAIYILNERREIVMKRIGAEYLDEVMQEIIRVDDLGAMEEQMENEKE